MARKKQNELTVKGQVKKIFYKSLTFTAGIISPDIRFRYKGLLNEGISGDFIGEYVEDEKYGKTYVISRYTTPFKFNPEYLPTFLSTLFKGIGPVTAEKVAKKGISLFTDDLDKLVEETGLKKVTLKAIQNKKHLYATYGFLLEKGIALSYIDTLYKKFGESLVTILKSEPYSLLGKVRGFSFKRIDSLALKLGYDIKSPERIFTAIHYTIKEAIKQGNSYIKYDELVEKVNIILHIDDINSIELIKNSIKQLEKEQKLYIIQDYVSYENILDKELYIKDFMMDNECLPLTYDLNFGPFSSLNEDQKDALDIFCKNRCCIISGPAGSGKTYLINSITTLCKQQGVKFILAATTGKAAKRMKASCSHEAYTLHKLLKYDGVRFNTKSIETDLLIIDEVSMAGIDLLYTTLKALKDNTRLVLIGDHHQLPSIEYGNVLKDLLKYTDVPKKILTKCVRQAGILKENSLKILTGHVEPTSKQDLGNNFRPWYKVTKFTTADEIYNYIKEIYSISLPKLKLDPIKDVQLITPVHAGLLGTKSLNLLIQTLLQGPRTGIDIGDKVICHKNLYDIDLMNGTQGIVIDKRADEMTIETTEKEKIKIPKKHMSHISLAYALTCHKFQGDQIPFAITICHKSHSYVHSRNFLYTAATRGMKSSAIIGDLWAITNCVKKTIIDERQTFISGL